MVNTITNHFYGKPETEMANKINQPQQEPLLWQSSNKNGQ